MLFRKRVVFFSLLIFMIRLVPAYGASDSLCAGAEKKMLDTLSSMHFIQLYGGADSVLFINQVWNNEENRCAIKHILVEKKGSSKVQFFAAEILLENCTDIPTEIDRAALGKLYAKAIRKNYTEGLNYWGMLDKDDVGPVGRHLLKIGKAAVPALKGLLNNGGGVFYYGSKTAEVGNGFRYRKKDVAAFFILKIMQYPFDWSFTRTERNVLIKKIKGELKKTNFS